MALRSRMSYGGAASSLHMLNINTTDKTVLKWEQYLGCNVRVQTMSWHAAHYDYLEASLRNRDRPLSWEIVRIRCDGTNVPAAQQHKAHVLEANTIFRYNDDHLVLGVGGDADDDAGDNPPLRPSTFECHAWAELQKIHHRAMA